MKYYLSCFYCMVISIFMFSCSNDMGDMSSEKGDISTRSLRAAHSFPDVSRIKSDPDVVRKMNEAWEAMKSYASDGQRREYGFYIYYNEYSDDIYCGRLQYGDRITGCAGTHGTLDLAMDDPITFNKTVCAHFHCHTTLQYCPPDVSRLTGPSSGDISLVNSRKLPGILYDYSAPSIYGGDSKNNNYKVQTFGSYTKRPDIYY
jgi:hypothetical protein